MLNSFQINFSDICKNQKACLPVSVCDCQLREADNTETDVEKLGLCAAITKSV
jgi:hypothetical protein